MPSAARKEETDAEDVGAVFHFRPIGKRGYPNSDASLRTGSATSPGLPCP